MEYEIHKTEITMSLEDYSKNILAPAMAQLVADVDAMVLALPKPSLMDRVRVMFGRLRIRLGNVLLRAANRLGAYNYDDDDDEY